MRQADVLRQQTQQVVEALLDQASAGRLLPGDSVSESDLARSLGVSRVAAQLAFGQLEDQEVLANGGDRGFQLAFIGPAKLRKILKLRFALERLAAAEICAAAAEGDDVYHPLAEIIERMRTVAAADDRRALTRLDMQFHRTMCELSGNGALVRAWEQISGPVFILFGLAATTKPPASTAEDHAHFLQSLRQGCPSNLDRTIQSHVFDNVLAIDFAAIVERLRQARLRDSTRAEQVFESDYRVAGVA